MKRWRRRLFQLAAAISVFLLLFTILLRLRSTSHTDTLMFPSRDNGRILITSHCWWNYIELTHLRNFTGPSSGHWHGWGSDVGPMLF